MYTYNIHNYNYPCFHLSCVEIRENVPKLLQWKAVATKNLNYPSDMTCKSNREKNPTSHLITGPWCTHLLLCRWWSFEGSPDSAVLGAAVGTCVCLTDCDAIWHRECSISPAVCMHVHVYIHIILRSQQGIRNTWGTQTHTDCWWMTQWVFLCIYIVHPKTYNCVILSGRT